MCVSFKTPSIKSGMMTPWSILYGSPMIFMYDLDLGKQGLSIEFRSTFLMFFKYFLIVDKLRSFASLFVVIMILLLVTWMKSVMIFDLEFFRHLLMLEVWMCAELTINSMFGLVIGIMTSFLDSPLVVILILGFLLLSLLFFAFNIFPTSFANKEGNASLTHKTSSMFDEIFALKACV